MKLTNFFLAMAPTAQNAADSTTAAAPGWTQFIPFILIFVLFYFLLIRPQTKKQKAHDQMVQSVKSGDRVIAAGGIYGIVTNVKDQSIILKVDDNTKLEIQKTAILTFLNDEKK